MQRKGTLFIITAPSGAGKTSLVNALTQSMNDIKVSVSYTTRPKRPVETDGINYHFVSDKEFEQRVHNNEFLEHATVFDYQYGTSRKWVEKQLAAGADVILEIDWQGGQKVMSSLSEFVSIFILPPTNQALESRLMARGQDSDEVIARRLSEAKLEMSHYHEYLYMIFNDDFATALADLQSIVRAHRLLRQKQEAKYQTLLESLLAS